MQHQPQLLKDILPTLQHTITAPRRTVLVGRIIAGEWTTQGVHNFCEYCGKYTVGYDFDCPHCGKETL